MVLKGKKILITAGPTWVAIDSVRVISNNATGKTGVLLADKLYQLGAKVSLLIGPVPDEPRGKGIRILRFKFFDELRAAMKKELSSGHYDIVIHAAAVSDYKPEIRLRRKVRSGLKHWSLKLSPTVKIIDFIKRMDRNILLVGFKFEPGASRATLVKDAQRLMRRCGADWVVANTVLRGQYHAWIVSREKVSGEILSRENLVRRLIREVS